MNLKEQTYKQLALTSMLFKTEAVENSLTPTMIHIASWFLTKKLSEFKTISDLTVPLNAINKMIRENKLVTILDFDNAPKEVTNILIKMISAFEDKNLGQALMIYYEFITSKGYNLKEIEKYVDIYYEELEWFGVHLRTKYTKDTEVDLEEEYKHFKNSN